MQVRILGPLEVWQDGHPVDLGAGRQRALLALLALHPREVVSVDRLIEALWGDSPPPTAQKALRNLISHLRRALGADAIVTHSSGYRLELEDDDLDARRFERLVETGRRTLVDDPRGAARTMREALDLWRGPALSDYAYEDFAQAEIRRLAELRLGAIEDRVDADLASGDAVDVSELEALVVSEPLRERLRGALMLALYRSGRQADALTVYRDGRALLREELGLEPSALLRGLEQAILNQDASLGLVSRPKSEGPRRRHHIVLVLGAAATISAGAAILAVLTQRGGSVPTVVPNTLVQIDPRTNEVVDVVPVGRDPGDVAVVGKYVFVSSEDDATLSRIEMATGYVTTTGAGGADTGLVGAGDLFVWVASRSQARVTRIDARNLLPIDFVPLPRDLAFAFVAVGGGSLWISHYPSSAVLRYRLRTLTLARRYSFAFAETPIEIAYGHGAAWVGLGGSSALLRIDGGTGQSRQIAIGGPPSDPAVGFGSVWTANFTLGEIKRVDAVSESVDAIVEVGNVPFGVAIGASSVWVTNHCDGTVSRIDPDTNDVVATIETGFFPKWLAVGGGFVWVGIGGDVFSGGSCN